MTLRYVPPGALFRCGGETWRHLGPSPEPGIHYAERVTPRDGYPTRDRFAARCPVENAPEWVGTATETGGA